MKRTQRRLLASLASLAAVIMPSAGFAQSEAEYVAKIGHLEAPTQPRHKALEMVAELVSERTDGAVEFQLFPASQLGNARQMVEGTQFGSVEGTVMPAAFLGGFNPVVSVLDLPYLLPSDPEEAMALREGPFGQYVLDSFDSRGLAAIMLWPNGFKNMTSNESMEAVADFEGQKFRVMDSNILIAQFEGLGASAVSLPFSELYTALQTGVVEGEENPLDTIATMKFYEVQDNLVLSEHGAMEDVVLFNPAWWNSLPDDYQQIIVEAFAEVKPKVLEMEEAAKQEALQTIRDSGMNVRELTAEERAVWREAMYPPAKEAYLDLAGEEGQKAIELYESEMERLNAS